MSDLGSFVFVLLAKTCMLILLDTRVLIYIVMLHVFLAYTWMCILLGYLCSWLINTYVYC